MSRPHSSESAFRAIADPHRRKIINLLNQRARTPGELCEAIKLTPPALTFHLRVLMKASLVSQQRRGRHRVYRINSTPLRTVNAWLASLATSKKKASS